MAMDDCLFIGRLPRNTGTRELEDIFYKYGRMTRCDVKQGLKMSYGFIEYEDMRDAEDAIHNEHGREMGGSRIVVEWARGPKYDYRQDHERHRREREGRHDDFRVRRRSRSRDRRRSRSRSRDRRRSRSYSRDCQKLDKAMKEGRVDYQGIDSVLVGIGGAGKTHTLAMILNEPLPDKRVSTPCTKPPVRTVTQVTIGEDSGVLERVEGEQYLSMVAITVREVARSLPPTSQPPVVRISPVEHSIRELEEKMVRYLQEDPEEDGMSVQIHRPLYKFRWNRLTDSGGQHQFLEVLTIFLHHISLGIFVIKLNERLDAFPMIEFYNHAGNSVGTPYKSRYSQEQVIRHFMRALISQGGKMGVKFLFIGTHRDRMEESKDESIQDKNEKLKKIIMSFNMKDNVIYSRVCNPIFAINAETPDDNDWKVMKQVRSELVKSANVPSIPIPIRWFAMELALQQYAQETKQAVLLESKCLELVANFRFNEANFKAALNYLHQIKHIYYYEGLVVADIAVIQKKLSEVVGFNIELCTNPSEALGAKWIKFSECGILHISCLDRFPSHYIEGVFTPKDLLQLFTSLCIVSQLNSDEYLMPCVLPVEEKAFYNPEPETQSVPAMVIEFPDGGPMLGVFCGLVCYLINTGKWKIATKSNGEPLHITRSSVHFLLPGFDKVTINDPLSTFFLVTFHGPSDEASQMCPLIRKNILNGIEEVSENLHYLGKDKAASVDTHSNAPVITFLCSCDTTPLHPAKCIDKYLKCPHSCKRVALTDEHRAWLKDVPSSHVSPSSDAASTSGGHGGMTVVKGEDVSFLMNVLSQHSYKWDVIGAALHFIPGELENIRHSPQVITPQQCLNAVLCQWVQWPTTAHPQTPTMEILRDALRSDLVGLGAMANKLYDARNQLPSCAATTSGEQAT